MTKDEALKMAIEWIEEWKGYSPIKDKVLKACKEALEQPAQEPVAWMDSEGRFRLDFRTEIVRSIVAVNKEIPLYTHPAPPCQECEDCKHDLDGYMEANKALINREFVGLSDDDIRVIAAINFCIKLNEVNDVDIDFAKDIEQALKDKNT